MAGTSVLGNLTPQTDLGRLSVMASVAITSFNKIVISEALGQPEDKDKLMVAFEDDEFSLCHGLVVVSQSMTLGMIRDALKKIILLVQSGGRTIGVRVNSVENRYSDRTLVQNFVDKTTGIAWLKVCLIKNRP